jgi:UDPglucose 6-dehydrogenase
MFKIGIIGLGFVGNAIQNALIVKEFNSEQLFVYDKYKTIGFFSDILAADILFLALPTIYNQDKKEYDKSPIIETLDKLKQEEFKGLVVLKSTVEPGTTQKYHEYYGLNIVHNPEFLTARTANEDFLNQKHVIIGKTQDNVQPLIDFYQDNFAAKISVCTSTESECMKLFCNCFYAAKVQMFTEFYILCQKIAVDYQNVKELMLANGWINPQHTTIPGPDGQVSYGGLCFPKDTNALAEFMAENFSPCQVLRAVIEERNLMRDDFDNIS